MPESSLQHVAEETVYAITDQVRGGELKLEDAVGDLAEDQENIMRLLKTWLDDKNVPADTQAWVYAGAALTYKAIETQEASDRENGAESADEN